MRKTWLTKKHLFVSLLAVLAFGCNRPAAKAPVWPYNTETREQRDARMKWWSEARFGMFIHWGVYSVPAGTYDGKKIDGIGEWIMCSGKIPVARYKSYAGQFNPVKYNPEQWVKMAKEAGMKYIVITSKHHDGFALFDSKVTDWDVVDATPYGKNLIKPLADACKKYGIRFGLYYSQAQDWCHVGGSACRGHWDKAQDGSMDDYIKNIAVPQVQEILSNYGEISVLWWDTPCDMNKERAAMFEPVMAAHPGIITNNRLGGGYPGDLETPEQHIPAMGFKDRYWETCMTMNDTWGYKSYDNNWKSTEMLLHNLVDIASKGGNYLLNVGPTSEGEIPQPSIERLAEIGKWMKVNGESIYGTTASPFEKLDWGRCTKKVRNNDATLYLHVFDWPRDGKLVVPGLKSKVVKASLLADKKSLAVSVDKNDVVITVPEKALDAIDTVVVLKIQGGLEVIKVLPKQNKNGVVSLSAIKADIHNVLGTDAKLEGDSKEMNIGFWTDSRAWVEWRFTVDTPGKFDVFTNYACEAQSSSFAVGLNETKIEASVNSTGGYDKYSAVKLGTIEISKSGEYAISIKPNTKGWNPINLRSITLKPVK